MGERKIYPFNHGKDRCPACGRRFAWWTMRSRCVESVTDKNGESFLRVECINGCGHHWLTEPMDLSGSWSDLLSSLKDAQDEIERLRAKLAEKGGHRG